MRHNKPLLFVYWNMSELHMVFKSMHLRLMPNEMLNQTAIMHGPLV